MVFNFHQNGIDMNHVTFGFAAWGAFHYLYSKGSEVSLVQGIDELEVDFRAAVREWLNGEPVEGAPERAYEILATFLYS